MLLIDTNGMVVTSNIAAQRLLGYSHKKFCNLHITSLIPLLKRDHHKSSGEPLKIFEQLPLIDGNTLIAVRDDGKEIEVNIKFSSIDTIEPGFLLISIYVTDRRRQAEEELSISEERLQLAKQAADLGVFDFDANHNVRHWDKKMSMLWGAESADEMPSKRFLTYIHPEDRAARQSALDDAINPSGNGEYKMEYRVVNPSDHSEHWVAAVGRMHFEDGHAIRLIGVARDVTEQKMLERKLQEHRAETETLLAQQVATQTASAIAHELNQPLAAISVYSEVALHAFQSKIPDEYKLKRALEGCVEQAQRAGKSLHELMAFLQKGDLITEKLNLNHIIKESLNIAKSNGYGGFKQVLQLEENLPPILGNRIQIQKILVNLLRNAAEAMQMINALNAPVTITVRTNNEMNMAHVTVQDSGPGLDPQVAKRIFEPFFTTKPTGIGMGLAISRALTEANGGKLWLEPDSNAGAIFHFTLPFAP